MARVTDFHGATPFLPDCFRFVSFCNSLHPSLKVGGNRGSHFHIQCRTDVFKFLFGGGSSHRFGRVYEIEDFNTDCLPTVAAIN